MQIADVFLYAGEMDMARLRWETLHEHVDAMIPVLATLTYQGEAAYYPIPDQLGVSAWTVPVDPPPERSEWGSPHWGFVEHQHREGVRDVAAFVRDVYGEDTVIMLSDVDEIPDPDTLGHIVDGVEQHGAVSVPMRMHGFALDYLHPNQPWWGTVASTIEAFDPQTQRDKRGNLPARGNGWHFSWFGSVEQKQRKLRSFSHGELQDTLDVEDCYRRGRHSNGEVMRKLSTNEMGRLSWPRPLFAGFPIPDSWWSPE